MSRRTATNNTCNCTTEQGGHNDTPNHGQDRGGRGGRGKGGNKGDGRAASTSQPHKRTGPPTAPSILLITKHPSPPSGDCFWSLKCVGAALELRWSCGVAAVVLRASFSKMSVSRGRCRKNDAQGLPLAPSEHCACSHVHRYGSMMYISIPHHRCLKKCLLKPAYAEPKSHHTVRIRMCRIVAPCWK
jgi:hypothetical protein